MSTSQKFIIYAPRYTDESGGSIVLHKLCDALNKQGHVAKLWPFGKPRISVHAPLRSLWSGLAYVGSRFYRSPFTTNKKYDTPVGKTSDIESSIVVYPEIISGNPLAAKRYVRWFLHQPGFHKGRVEYKKNDLCFSYQDAFNKTDSNIKYGGSLTISETYLDIYKLKNTGNRTKVCYMVRKGKARLDLPDLSNQCVVDGRTHQELAEIFNECEICYFYDPYTVYACYAAVCGCIPVIVPIVGVTKNEWVPEEVNRYGLAYGNDDIPQAIATRGLMLDRLGTEEQRNTTSVRHFVFAVQEYFSE